jgi:Ca2+-dependent lipid-binding protein
MGLPKVEISAIPMIDLPVKLNAMNIPGLSTFISNSINTAIDEYGKSASSLVACVIVR